MGDADMRDMDVHKVLHQFEPHHPLNFANAHWSIIRAPLVCILLCFLWAINLLWLDVARVDVVEVLDKKARRESEDIDKSRRPSWKSVLHCAVFFFSLYVLCVLIFFNLCRQKLEVALIAFYFLVSILLIFQQCTDAVKENVGAVIRLFTLIFFPASTITFNEVLFADALTSLSKVLLDIAVSSFVFLCGLFPTEQYTHYHHHILLTCALVTSFPYLVRVRQCWIQFCGSSSSSAKLLIMTNIGKYICSIPAIWFVTFKNMGLCDKNWADIHAFRFTVASSIYSLLWDIIMDWGLLSFSRGRVVPRKTFMFTCGRAYAAVALLVNTCLRFSWAVKYHPQYSNMNNPEHFYSSALEVGEVFRRSVWNVLRIEWEVYQRTSQPLPMVRNFNSLVLQGSLENGHLWASETLHIPANHSPGSFNRISRK